MRSGGGLDETSIQGFALGTIAGEPLRGVLVRYSMHVLPRLYGSTASRLRDGYTPVTAGPLAESDKQCTRRLPCNRDSLAHVATAIKAACDQPGNAQSAV